jgi:multidrug transporter EmrE-like cation transporter
MLGMVLLLVAVTIEACGQVLFKLAAHSLGQAKASKTALAVFCLAIEAVIWTAVLKCLDLSVAYPMGSLCFVAVLIASRLLLKEKISLQRLVGVALILGGNVMVGLS